MRAQPRFVQPPRLAVRLLTLFALDDRGESILGDLLEEFSLLASTSGVRFARRWYRRQTLKTILQLAILGFRTAPWLATASVVGGFFLRRVAGRLVSPTLFAVLDRYQVYQHHSSMFIFFFSTGFDVGQVIASLFVGFMVALVARGREMAATTVLSLIFGAMMVVALPLIVTHEGYGVALSRGMWSFADYLAIVIAGAIVRTHRSGVAARGQL